MRLGWTLSGAGHLGLMLVVLFGGLFAGEQIPESVVLSEVSILSEEEFAALARPATAPETQSDAPQVALPEPVQDAPEAPAEDSAPEVSAPEPVEAPETPDSPEFEVEPPVPQAVVVEDAPAEPAPPSEIDGTTATPDQVAAPAPRVAPVPQVAPPPEAEAGPELIEDSTPDPEAPPAEPQEDTPAQAPEAASDRIVTEAEEEKTYAPASSKRPRSRPARPVRTAEPPRTTPATDDAVAAALAEAAAPDPEPAVAPGPRLSGGQREDFKASVQNCWITDPGAPWMQVVVVVGFELDRSRKVVGNKVRQVSIEGGDAAAQRTAFEKAKRAVLRCQNQNGGFRLPAESFGRWQQVEIKFGRGGVALQ
ncbi:MAG: hypothetical protein OIF48_17950 [Silicimonas sp.]|nr:hypothetical protein [Silicimonas sp.]